MSVKEQSGCPVLWPAPLMAPWCLVTVGLSSALASTFDGSMVFSDGRAVQCFGQHL